MKLIVFVISVFVSNLVFAFPGQPKRLDCVVGSYVNVSLDFKEIPANKLILEKDAGGGQCDAVLADPKDRIPLSDDKPYLVLLEEKEYYHQRIGCKKTKGKFVMSGHYANLEYSGTSASHAVSVNVIVSSDIKYLKVSSMRLSDSVMSEMETSECTAETY